jgi:hypothetical protein
LSFEHHARTTRIEDCVLIKVPLAASERFITDPTADVGFG